MVFLVLVVVLLLWHLYLFDSRGCCGCGHFAFGDGLGCRCASSSPALLDLGLFVCYNCCAMLFLLLRCNMLLLLTVQMLSSL